MRILHTADWHLGKSLEKRSRIDEQKNFLDDFIEIAKENNIDLVIIAGDIYDSSNPPAIAEKMFYDTLKKISDNGKRLILIIAGNHDNPERLVASAPLAKEHGIIMIGTLKTIIDTGNYGRHKIINSGEGFIEIEINGEKAIILTVPYLSEKRLNEVLYKDMDSDEERIKSYSDRVFSLFDSLKDNYREDTINLLVSHLYAMGSEEGGSERSIQLGGSYIVNCDCFPKEAQYIALGHVHKPQLVPGTNKKARYSGSPIHYNKKEVSYNKKCFVVDVKANEEANVKEVYFKVYKPIEIWKCENFDDALLKCEENKDRECWVYLEIKVDRYMREDEIKKLKELKKDILEITPIIENIHRDDESAISLSEKSFEELFIDFYKKERMGEPDKEIIDLFLNLVYEEENGENETN
ncbi:exonuclease SbcCD subunit D [Sarcina sp. JB2]|uniref:Exonuclease SbcCD subunit D n=1 Tax=Candidatus Sarcina troglodytae TaxID=2726954 RepID=A0ACD1BBJ4_9CLOT|nr:exonuclease SbcCD subunit D [Sarcina sp. JB2]QPJ84808.1 exonuclease SbcCD subunit D [Sarcina sp. JB2]